MDILSSTKIKDINDDKLSGSPSDQQFGRMKKDGLWCRMNKKDDDHNTSEGELQLLTS